MSLPVKLKLAEGLSGWAVIAVWGAPASAGASTFQLYSAGS